MPRYEHVLPKDTGNVGFASDPPQDMGNAQSGLVDKELTTRNAVILGIGAAYTKRIVTTGFNAALQMTGSSRYERYVEVGTTIGKYALIGVASGPAAVFTVPAAILGDLALAAIDDAVKGHELNLQNERVMIERGARRKGYGGFYD